MDENGVDKRFSANRARENDYLARFRAGSGRFLGIFSALTPLVSRHVKPYCSFELDMDERITIEAESA